MGCVARVPVSVFSQLSVALKQATASCRTVRQALPSALNYQRVQLIQAALLLFFCVVLVGCRKADRLHPLVPINYGMTWNQVLTILGPKSRINLNDGPTMFVSTNEVGDQGYRLEFRKDSNIGNSRLVGINLYRLSDYEHGSGSLELRSGDLAVRRGYFAAALKLYQTAASKGDVAADRQIAVLYANGLGVKADGVKAFRLASSSARKGDAQAEDMLGQMFLNGVGTKANAKEAMNRFQQAASHGLLQGQYDLALIYERGRAVPQDHAKAREMMKIAARQGFRKASLFLACSSIETTDAASILMNRQLKLIIGTLIVKGMMKAQLPVFDVDVSRLKFHSVVDTMETIDPRVFGCSAIFFSNIKLGLGLIEDLPSVPLDATSFGFSKNYVMSGAGGSYSVALEGSPTWKSSVRLTSEGLP
jgi:Sel1 repeat